MSRLENENGTENYCFEWVEVAKVRNYTFSTSW